MLCRLGSSDCYACVNGVLAACVRRLLSDIVSDELLSGSYDGGTLLKAWSVGELPLRPTSGYAVVEHLECFFVALNQSTKTHFFTASMGLVRDVVMGVGALMVTGLSSIVMLSSLMPQTVQDCSTGRLTNHKVTKELFLVDFKP